MSHYETPDVLRVIDMKMSADELMKFMSEMKDKKLTYMRAWHRKTKDEVFNKYGGYRCACCGETEKIFLVIDHIAGGGNEERRKYGTRGGAGQYSNIKAAGFPPGYQVLCHNCNYAKTRGVCPHASEERETETILRGGTC